MRAAIVAGGAFRVTPYLRRLLAEADLVVAADAGAATLRQLGILPHLAVGDFDSCDQATLDDLAATNCQIERFPVAKDASDTELALQAALEKGADDIVILGATGGPRLDHLLANVLLLASPTLHGRRVRLVDDCQEMALLRNSIAIEGSSGDLVTLLPLETPADGLHTTGLLYPLANGSIQAGSTLGLSNVMTAARATVRVERGSLLVIHRFCPQQAAADGIE